MKNETGAPAVILDWVRNDDDTDGLDAEYYRIKIFTDEGKKYGNVEEYYIDSYPIFGKMTDISARTIRPDGTTVSFDGTVYDKVVYRAGRATLRAKTFSLPDVQAGSIVEYRFIRRSASHILTSTWWSVQRDIPILHCKLTLKPYAGREFSSYFAYMGLPDGKKPSKTGDHYDLELTNVPAFRSEDFAPPEEQLKPRVTFYYTTDRVLPANFWAVESTDTSKKIESFVGDGSALRSTVLSITSDAPTPLAKLQKIYAHVQSWRNLSFDPDSTERPAARNAAAVVKSGAGRSEEINRAFVALARAAGFEADVVRVAPRDKFFFSDKLPDAEQMSDEIALVKIDSTPTFLDPGTAYAPFAVVAWQKTNVPSYRVTKRGPEWMQTPQPSLESAIVQRSADLRLDGESLKGTISVAFVGQEALKRRLSTLGSDEAGRKKAFQDELGAWLPEGAKVVLTNLTGVATSERTIAATFDVELPNSVSHAGSRTVVPASLFTTRAKNPFVPTTRTHPIYFEYPRSEEDEVKLTLPTGMSASAVPQAEALDAGALRYKSSSTRDASTVTFRRSMFVDTIFVDRQYYGALRRFFGAVAAADAKPFVLQASK